ncbi:MAG: Rne/Rng family ribonuclease [Deltaproteobacteria bacterium]|nr:Rne/Rng family ribonuclease [Deltaproteobacteria bacterium]
MSKELIINDTHHETRVALLENGNLEELIVERRVGKNITGHIYKGKVIRVLPGMQAAFVDVGQDQAAFIYVTDVYSGIDEYERLMVKAADEEVEEKEGIDDEALFAKPSLEQSFHIEELLQKGQDILVQVSKAPIGSKGARITSHISIPGRFLVLMPRTNHIGISRRIEDEGERDRLRQIISELKPEQYGFIARTLSEGASKEKFASEMDFLSTLWENIQKRYANMPAPSLLHKELDVTLRAVRDLFTQEADRLIIDSRSGYESILKFLDTFMPRLKDSVELYDSAEPIFDAYNLETEIARALKKKVWLKSGGHIVIENTEAFVVIDINTGRYVGKRNLEETVLKINLEAVKEIAYQIRLRNIGGLIIIDFIDMEKETNREKVFNALREALKKDRTKTNVLPMTEMGIIQMTRKRTRENLNRMLCEPCFYCEGEGCLKSRITVCYDLYREVKREAGEVTGDKITVKVHPDVADLLMGEEHDIVESLEKNLAKEIVILADSRFHVEQYEINGKNTIA